MILRLEENVLRELAQKLNRYFPLPGIIRDCGVICNITQGYYQCKVHAFFRNLNGVNFFSFKISRATRLSYNCKYLDLDKRGMQKMRSMIESLEHEISQDNSFENKV